MLDNCRQLATFMLRVCVFDVDVSVITYGKQLLSPSSKTFVVDISRPFLGVRL